MSRWPWWIAALAAVAVVEVTPSSSHERLLQSPSSAAVLAQLPDGEFKRRFIIDCTNCHQFDARVAYPGGKTRTQSQWVAEITRMLTYAGATTGFPIMSADRDADSTAAYLAKYLTAPPTASDRRYSDRTAVSRAEVVEYMMPSAQDLPHDVAIDSGGSVVVTGMFSHTMYVLDTTTKSFEALAIPVERGNPRAIEIARNGDWWVLLGNPMKVARYEPGALRWSTFDIGVYAHSVALAGDSAVWYNGHFTRDPEQIGVVTPQSGAVRTFAAPRHPTMAVRPGGPIPYELRTAPDGTLWMSELQGNRMISFDPRTSTFKAYDMPTTVSAPRRFDIDSAGTLWIPAYAANALVRFEPQTGRFREIPLPVRDAVPYIARVDAKRGVIWVGTNASDELYAYDPAEDRYTVYPLPSAGVVVRHMVVHPATGDLWLAYGASPGIAARIARLIPEPKADNTPSPRPFR